MRACFPLRLLVYLVLIGLTLPVEVRLVIRFGFQRVLLENTLVECVGQSKNSFSTIGFMS